MKKNSTDSRKAHAMLTVSRVLVYALLIFLSILCLFSFYMLIVNASRTNADLQGGFKALPQGHFLENLKNAWNDSSINIPRGMLNSFIIAAATAILSTYFSALTAYGLHAYNFKLKRLAFLFIMAVMVIPKQVSAAGFVQLCYKLKLTNSYLPLILPGIAAPVVFFYMIQYMKSVLPMEIVEAARLAGAERFILALKDGFDTYVGERGVKLSGGQKQRIAIARVFLKNPSILILDEATSALDNESEILVGQSLEKLAHGRTTLTIAHRLTTIKDYDRILVLGEEGIVESGTHEQLLAKQGVYYRLWNQLPGEDTL